jgi:hypothetical protein
MIKNSGFIGFSDPVRITAQIDVVVCRSFTLLCVVRMTYINYGAHRAGTVAIRPNARQIPVPCHIQSPMTGFHRLYPPRGYPSAAIAPVLQLLQKYNQTNTKVNR